VPQAAELKGQEHGSAFTGATIGPLAKRDTLVDMEIPDSTPPAEDEAYVTGQVLPRASGSDLPGTGAPGTGAGEPDDDEQAAPGRVWPFLFKPRWLAWHLFVAVAFLGMLWLGDWQYHRAIGGNGLSWAYTFEWPLFAVFAVVFWGRTIRDEFIVRHGGVTEAELVAQALLAAKLALPEGVGVKQVEAPDYPAYDVEDPELASYNAYLAKLNTEFANGRKQITAG
jgi:hypothetical protein